MRKALGIGLFVLLMFLSFDSFGLASLAQTWLPVNFFQTNPIPQVSSEPFQKRIEKNSSLNDLFDYRSFRRIQTSA